MIDTSGVGQDLIDRIVRCLERNNELQNRLGGILQNCERHLDSISIGILALANITQPTFPQDLYYAAQHAATLRERRR